MADVYVNALTQLSTEPTSTDSIVLVNRNTNEGQIVDYNLLADKVLEKLRTKIFSNLATTSKVVTGAINELDGDVGTLNAAALPAYLPSSITDLNDLRTTSVYSLKNERPANLPLRFATNNMPTYGTIVITYRIEENVTYQILIGMQDVWNTIFTRRYISGSWQDWYCYDGINIDNAGPYYDVTTDEELKAALIGMTQKARPLELVYGYLRALNYSGSMIQSGNYACLISKETTVGSTSNYSTILFYSYGRSKLYLFKNTGDLAGYYSIVEFTGTQVASW